MRGWGHIFMGAAVAAGTILWGSPAAWANDYGWKDGRWRLELSGFTAFRSGNRSRTGDIGLVGSVEYEVPLVKHLTFGIKAYPLFLYNQNDPGEDTVFGIGLGPEFRVYSNGAEHRGFYVEIGTGVLAATGRFDGNSGAVNFLNEGGLGYKFKRGWHVAAKISHVSNLGFAFKNSGVNNLGIGIGYTF